MRKRFWHILTLYEAATSHLQEYPVNIGPVREYPVVKVIKNKFINLNMPCFSFVGWAKSVNFDIGECQSSLYICTYAHTHEYHEQQPHTLGRISQDDSRRGVFCHRSGHAGGTEQSEGPLLGVQPVAANPAEGKA